MDSFQKSSLPFLFIFSLILHTISAATDTLDASQSIKDGETLVSSGGIFELGFFSPENSTNRYVGIWYNNITIRTNVWVANRQVPLTTKSGVLTLTKPGILALFNDTNGTIIWSSNSTMKPIGNPEAQLLDSGNMVIKDSNEGSFIWQSFDHPTDTLLPGMSMGWNYVKGFEIYLTSWRSNDDPYPGEFTAHFDPTGYPQMINKRAGIVLYRIGPWDGLRMSGASRINSNDGVYKLTVVMNENEAMYREDILQKSVLTMIKFNPNGISSRLTWNFRTQAWIVYSNVPSDSCDTFNTCGAHGSCNVGDSPPCSCLDGFVPEDPESWGSTDWSRGCVRRTPLKCEGDVFLKYSEIKLPDARNATFDDKIVLLSDCEAECLSKCDCVAYRQLNMSGAGSGCLFYHGDLIDIRDVPQSTQDIYIRMASTESAENVAHSEGKKRVILIATVAGVVLMCIILIIFCIQKRRFKKNSKRRREAQFSGSNGKEAALPFFNLSTILKATDQFSDNNKLGEGGFGPVYRGVLEDGQEIAAKRLSETSSQGMDELKNEVILIAKLQHRNLVRLLGCCIERDENMLIYEYMPNSSLDLILFDEAKSMLLDWGKRFHIINGIAKGLLYLHQDSRLRIIHRDLKASNILLDADLNPKISDFGLARSFIGNEIAAKTHRVVGTYGYMSPEYAMDGLFSIKSDVFSFGVLVLEIVSGKRNRGFFAEDHNLNLLGYAWTLYEKDNLWKLVDDSIGDSFDLSQVLRSIHVSLLCVQKSSEDRPSMSSVVFMLGNEVALPQPKLPAFFTEVAAQSSPMPNASNSVNQVTITLPQGR